MTDRIDTAELLSRVDIVQVIDGYVPLTKSGAEYEACCPFHTEATPSFKVSPSKQFYNCFGCGANGDAIKFLTEYKGVSFLEACRELGADVPEAAAPGGDAKPKAPPQRAPIREKKESPWTPIMPAPANAPEPPKAHVKRGLPERVWCYRAGDGAVLGYVYRFKTSDGGKEVLPLTWCRNEETGELEWHWMAFPEPRPLYGLDRLASVEGKKAILLVEGEKCADAGHAELARFGIVVMSWAGGGKAVKKSDFSPLYSHELPIMLWADCDGKRVPLKPEEVEALIDDGRLAGVPAGKDRTALIKELTEKNKQALADAQAAKPLLAEADQPGVKTMAQIAAILLEHGSQVWKIKIPVPGEKPDGWDVADAVADGLGGDALAEFLRSSIVPVGVAPKSPAPSEGEVAAEPPSGGEGVRGGKKAAKESKPINWERYNDLLENFVLIYGTDTCYDRKARMIIKVNHLRLAFGSDYVKMWLNSDRRRMIVPDQLVFDPSCRVQEPAINLFEGFAMKPKKGDYSSIIELLAHLCADSAESEQGVEAVIDWALKWLALPLQRPGTKMRSALVFHGPQGAGKNLFFEIVAKIYGRYALVVGQEQLEDKFNDWASQKLFLIGDEVVARQELYHQKNKLKAFITGETIQINTKMMPLRTEANHVNVVFLSNEHQPLALEDGDRRYFVVYTPPRRHDDLYRRVAACLEVGGAEAFHRYLLDYDLGDFSEFDIPPMTTAKRDLIELGLKPAERFIREWLQGYLPLPLQVCSAGQLYRAFRRWCVLTGERFPPIQEQFSKSVNKSVALIGATLPDKAPPLRYKVVKLDDSLNGKRADRMWLPSGCGKPESMTEGVWAADSVASFESKLADFIGAEVKAAT